MTLSPVTVMTVLQELTWCTVTRYVIVTSLMYTASNTARGLSFPGNYKSLITIMYMLTVFLLACLVFVT